MNSELAFDLEDLAVDMFEIGESGLTVDSLTGGHGMTEVAASCPPVISPTWACSSSCCCCSDA